MRKLVIILSLLFSGLALKPVFATHFAGGEITYEHVTGNTYQITCNIYRDCAGVAAPGTVTIDMQSSSCGLSTTTTLSPVSGTGQEISFNCLAVTTTCSGGTAPGIQYWEYTGTVNLPGNCSDWSLSTHLNARNNAITTIVNPGDEHLYLEATLNNLDFSGNNSPAFFNYPISITCQNQSYTYNHGAYDEDGDSLYYSFITPRSTNASDFVVYQPGYSVSNPLSSTPPVQLNSSNGNITMNATATEVAIMAVLVQEFRDGVLIGSTLRDIQVYTTNCTNNLPLITGIDSSSSFIDTICANEPYCINIYSYDLDGGDTVRLTSNNSIPGATFTVSSSQFPVGTFCWTPGDSMVRSTPYSLVVNVIDNACDFYGVQAFSFDFYVIDVLDATYAITDASCAADNDGAVDLMPTGDTPPFTYLWNTGATSQDLTGISDGSYSVQITDADGCYEVYNGITVGTTEASPPASGLINR